MVDYAKLVVGVETKGVHQTKRELDGLDKSTKSATGQAKLLKSAVAGIATSAALRQVIQYSDAWQQSANQLRLVTTGTVELADMQQRLMDVANGTRSSFESTAELYTKLARSTESLNLSSAELVQLTTDINNGLRITGGDAQAASGAIRQLGQALASGALRGDEFNSIAEQAPVIMDALASSLNMTRGELREFAAEGGITSEILVRAMQDYSDVISEQVSTSVDTFGQKLTIVRNNILEFIGDNDNVTASLGMFGDKLITLSENLDEFTDAASLVWTAVRPGFNELNNGISVITDNWHTMTMGIVDNNFTITESLATVGMSFTTNLSVGVKTTAAQMQNNFERIRLFLKKGEMSAKDYQRAVNDLGQDYNFAIADILLETNAANQEFRDMVLAAQENRAAFRELGGELEPAGETIQEVGERAETAAGQLGNLSEKANNVSSENSNLIEQYQVIPGLIESATDSTKDYDDALGRMYENIQREWGDTLYELLDEGELRFDSFFDAVLDGFKRMIAEMAAQDLMAAIFKTGGGGNLAGLAGSAGSILSSVTGGASSLLGALIPGGANSMVSGGTALGGLAKGAGALLSNPWTWGIGALALGASNDWWSDPDDYQRTNAGLLVGPTPGLKSQYNKGGVTFDSGFSATAFGRRTTDDILQSVLGQYSSTDSAITSAVRALGGTVNLSGVTLNGVGEDGVGAGTFMGAGQVDSFAQQILRQIGLDNGVSDPFGALGISSSAGADEIINALNQALDENTKATQDQTEELKQIFSTRDALTAVQLKGSGSTRGALDFLGSNLDIFEALNPTAQDLLDYTGAQVGSTGRANIENVLQEFRDAIKLANLNQDELQRIREAVELSASADNRTAIAGSIT